MHALGGLREANVMASLVEQERHAGVSHRGGKGEAHLQDGVRSNRSQRFREEGEWRPQKNSNEKNEENKQANTTCEQAHANGCRQEHTRKLTTSEVAAC